MAEFKGNSFKERSDENKNTRYKLTKVTTNPTSIKPKSEAKKLLQNVAPDVIEDVVSPAIRSTASDVASHIFDMLDDMIRSMLFPDGGEMSRGRYSRYDRRERVSYGAYYSSGRNGRDRSYARARSSNFDVEDVIFRTRGEAESVLYAMDEAISQFHVVTVGDFYDLSDISTTNMPHTMHKYGWTDLRDATVRPVPGGFIIKFPRPMPID